MKLFSITALCASLTYVSLQALLPQEMLQNMTLEQKIGQLMVVAAVSDPEVNAQFMQEQPYTMDQEHVTKCITDYHVGGIIFLGAGKAEKQFEVTKKFQECAQTPLLICMDFEWGLTMRLKDGLRFARNMALGALAPEDDSLIYQMGYEVGLQCKALGVHMNLAPVVDVNNNPKNPIINDRSFGQDKEQVARKAMLYMQGLHDAGIIACAKHFPGHGDTDMDSHYDLPRIAHSRDRLNDIELYPFKQMIAGGVQAIMTAHLEVPAFDATPHLPSSLSHNAVTKILREELGFEGVIITDGLGMVGVTKHHALGQLEIKALLAGNDILLCPVDVPQAVAAIKQAVLDGRLSYKDLDKKVLKMLTLKAWAHVADAPQCFDQQKLFTPAAQRLKQQLYAHAVTIARDAQNLVPTIGRANQTIGLIEIGPDGQPCEFATILKADLGVQTFHLACTADEDAVQEVVSQVQSHDVVIVGLLGMNRSAKQNFGICPSTRDLVKKLKQMGKKTVVVVFGNAYSLPLMDDASAVVVAYEDDPDAQKAAALALMGKIQARGKLPV